MTRGWGSEGIHGCCVGNGRQSEQRFKKLHGPVVETDRVNMDWLQIQLGTAGQGLVMEQAAQSLPPPNNGGGPLLECTCEVVYGWCSGHMFFVKARGVDTKCYRWPGLCLSHCKINFQALLQEAKIYEKWLTVSRTFVPLTVLVGNILQKQKFHCGEVHTASIFLCLTMGRQGMASITSQEQQNIVIRSETDK